MAITMYPLVHLDYPDRGFGWHKEAAPKGTAKVESLFDSVRRVVKPPTNVTWTRRAPILNQGDLGSCTGNALASWYGTDGGTRSGVAQMTENFAIMLYKDITAHDEVPGQYPPSDTGSSSPAVGNCGVRRKMFKSYSMGSSLNGLIKGLQTGPVIVGSPWKSGMMETITSWGLLTYTGGVVGGHEFLCYGVNIGARHLYCANSWGSAWGNKGTFTLRFGDFQKMINDGADLVIPVV